MHRPMIDVVVALRRIRGAGWGRRRRRGRFGPTPVSPLFGAALALFAAGCDSAEQGAATGNGADLPLEANLEAVYALGGVDAPDWQQFVEVSQVRFDCAGNLVVLDRRETRIAVAGPDGRLLHVVSQAGDGPGELRMVRDIEVLQDNRLVVSDLGHRAFLLFDEGGQYVERFPFGDGSADAPPSGVESPSSPGTFVSRGRAPSVLGALSGARLLTTYGERVLAIHTLGAGASELYRAYSLPADAVDGDGGPDAVVGFGGMQLSLPGMSAGVGFGPPLAVAALSDDRTAIADTVGYRVKIVREDGVVGAVLERPIDPVPVTQEMRDAARKREASGGGVQVFLTGAGGVSASEGDALAARLAEAMAAGMRFASQVPVVSGVAVDSEDRVWVTRTGDDGVSRGPADVFSADGGYVGTLAPGDFRVPDAFGPDGLMAYVEVDDMDVPTVRVVRLAGLESER